MSMRIQPQRPHCLVEVGNANIISTRSITKVLQIPTSPDKSSIKIFSLSQNTYLYFVFSMSEVALSFYIQSCIGSTNK